MNQPMFEREIDMDIFIADSVGMNIDWDAIHFGVQRPGGVVIRHINLTNIFGKDAIVVFSTGDSELAEWVTTPVNPLHISDGESIKVNIACQVPADAVLGNYTGKFYISYYDAEKYSEEES
jgi:RNAse (barnase) inhibitor barstar